MNLHEKAIEAACDAFVNATGDTTHAMMRAAVIAFLRGIQSDDLHMVSVRLLIRELEEGR